MTAAIYQFYWLLLIAGACGIVLVLCLLELLQFALIEIFQRYRLRVLRKRLGIRRIKLPKGGGEP